MPNSYWWEEDPINLAECVTSYVDELQKNQSYRDDLNEQNLRLYGSDIYSQSVFSGSSKFSYETAVQYNVIRSVCDTMTSTIAHSSSPTPFFQIHKGDWSVRRKAQKNERFVKAQMSRTGFYMKSRAAFHDGTIFGTGCVHFFINERNELECEKVWPGEIVVDEMECVDSPPSQMHRIKPVHRNKLRVMYPDYLEEIARAEQWKDPTIEMLYPGQDMVRMIESIHLPTTKKSKDGRIVRSISTKVLMDEPYEDFFFPYAFVRWSKESRGFWGRGIAQLITGIQVNLNILLLSKAEMLRYTVPKIVVQKASGIKADKITNRIGGAYTSSSPNPIEVVKLGTVPQEITQEEQNLYQKAFEVPGVSQLTAISKMPSRLDSSLALNEALEIQSQRFARQYSEWHEFVKDCTKIILSYSGKIAEKSESYKVATKWKGRMMEIDYKDTKLDPDDYSIEVKEINDTPDSPWGRTEILQQLFQAGLITPSQLMEYNWSGKDIEGLMDEINADENNLEWTLEEIVEKDEYRSPEAFQNIPLGIKKFKQAYLNLKSLGCPEDKLELIRRWIGQAQELERKASAPAMTPTPLAGGPESLPVATPAPAPQSDLLPFPTTGPMQ